MVRPANQELAEKILLATAEIIEENGPDSITMRGVADRIGYSATTIYLYFENKDDLLDQTVVRAFGWFADAMLAAVESSAPDDRIRNRARAYVTWALSHGGMYRLMFQHDSIRPLDSETRSVQPRTLVDSVALIADAIESGSIPGSPDADTMARINWAGLHGVVSLAMSGRLFGAPDERAAGELERRSFELADEFVSLWLGEDGSRQTR